MRHTAYAALKNTENFDSRLQWQLRCDTDQSNFTFEFFIDLLIHLFQT